MTEKKINYDDLVEEHYINKYDSLLDIINIENDKDIRENFIFRGVKKAEYELIPSSLRKINGKCEINRFIDGEEFIFEIERRFRNDDGSEICSLTNVDKSCHPINKDTVHDPIPKEIFQFKREVYVLLKFLNYADKTGLKVPTSPYVRRRIHNYFSYPAKEEEIWPEPDFYEIISLAQHYGLPTRALDWSYDFKVALYFAVEDVLNNKPQDCALWAFNYKLFEDNYNSSINMINPTYEKEELLIYRPEYSNNLNLMAQKGLFTFLPVPINKTNNIIPFDKGIVNLLNSWHKDFYKNEHLRSRGGYKWFEIEKNQKIFHKFVINGDLKLKILEDLYKEDYSPENIFPGFNGVVDSIEKRAKLKQLMHKND